MGVVNVTPDSFSDGGKFNSPEAPVEHALQLIQEGADIIDIGGESTRPRATPVSEAEEMSRVLPVIQKLIAEVRIPLSIDTMKPAVAKAAMDAGASIINDVAANRDDPAMWQAVAGSGAGYVCMHMQGNPQTMQVQPSYQNVVAEVGAFFEQRLNRLKGCGVSEEQIIFDPGIGFGKSLEHNLQLLGNLGRFRALGRPLMLGVSRKSFIAKLLGTDNAARLPAALACAALAVQAGVQIIRTHDVADTVKAVRMAEAIIAKADKAE